ncbi:MAG: hypothetical protein K9H64_21210 [Bacteroidales bacterium]|nr:hypothetical protein [Bacteroidales bacterium]MCF8458559.1 hypothetical protein [Bacteroidales bacterium]
MKKIALLMFIALFFFSCGNEKEIILETSSFQMRIDEKGFVTAFSDLVSGENFIYPDSISPLLSIRRDMVFAYPQKATLDESKENILLKFEDDVSAKIKMLKNDGYLTFELISMDKADEIDLIVWGPYCTKVSETIGETVGVIQDKSFALGIQALNPRTLGGYPWSENDCLPQIDIFEDGNFEDISSENRRYVLYRVEAAKPTDFGSSLQAYCRNRNKERIVENWEFDKYVFPSYNDGGIIGSKIALFGCAKNIILSVISSIEINENLPHPLINGQWGKTSREAASAYLILNFSEADIERAVEITEKAGLKYLYHSGPFESWGHFPLQKGPFPNGWTGMKNCVDYASKHGISVGVHTLSNFITTNDAYVTPVPDKRLAYAGKGKLTEAIDDNSTTLSIDARDYFDQLKNSNLKTVRIGDELIRYGGISDSEPWQLTDCQRGQFGTTASAHEAGSEIFKLADHAYKVFLSNPELTLEIGKNLAGLYNETGLRQISFDGLEGCRSTGMGNYGEILLTSTWYDHLSDDIKKNYIADASRTSHFFWHIYTRMNWGEPWYAGFRESQQEYRLKNQKYFKRNLMPGMLGWFLMRPGTSLEDIEWLLARSAGFDAGYAFVMNYESLEKNGNADRILELIGQWEKLRMDNAIPDSLKLLMQDVKNEFELRNGNEIVQIDSKKFTFQNSVKQPGEPNYTTYTIESQMENSPLNFIISAHESQVSNISIEIDNYKTVQIPLALTDNETLKYIGGNEIVLFDENWNMIKKFEISPSDFIMSQGEHAINFSCDFNGEKGDVKVEFRTEGVSWNVVD